MQHAIPYRSSLPTATTTTARESRPGDDITPEDVRKLVRENAVIVFGRRGCCMCHVVKLLLLGLGVNPTVSVVDDEHEAAVADELSKVVAAGDGEDGGINDVRPQFPVVFVGGKLFGGLERVMATHISGELVPILKDAGALWL